MFAQRNYVYLAILAAIGLAASTATAADKPAPATQPAASPASAQLPATPAPTTAPAETAAREIPLEKVWAYQMPGTHPMEMPLADDGKTYATADGKILSEVLAGLKDFGSDVRGGFAVAGIGSTALAEAHKVLAGGASPGTTLDRNQKISLAFFSNQPGLYVHLKKITQKGGLVEIAYRFVSRDNKDATPQLAIIPLFDVPAGTLKIVLRSEGVPNTPAPVDPHDVAGQQNPAPIIVDCSLRSAD
jgi:hypothetical protein